MKIYYVDVSNLQSEYEKLEVLEKFNTGGWTYWEPKRIATHEYPQVSKIIYAVVSYDFGGEPIFPDIPPNCKITTYEPSL